MSDRIFGHIHGTQPGDLYATRQELSAAGVHRPPQAGISGSQRFGADSIVLSGGYEDDEDHGTIIIYTGHGGLDPTTREMVEDRNLTRQNLALAMNVNTGNPSPSDPWSRPRLPLQPTRRLPLRRPLRVTDYRREQDKSGHYVWRYRLEAIPGESLPNQPTPDAEIQLPERMPTIVQRIVRDTTIAQHVKELHEYRCQVCGTRLETPAGPYAESAHIRPLGHPHNGPDDPDNILCLCPNHHVLFDRGAIGIRNNHELIGIAGRLRTVPKHAIDSNHLGYHRHHIMDPLSLDRR